MRNAVQEGQVRRSPTGGLSRDSSEAHFVSLLGIPPALKNFWGRRPSVARKQMTEQKQQLLICVTH